MVELDYIKPSNEFNYQFYAGFEDWVKDKSKRARDFKELKKFREEDSKKE